jgi:ubiquinone/menaquinone biosynthesis C-methylase UbiE
MIPSVVASRRVLIVGDGDGRFLEAFLRAVPDATVDSVDISPAMIARAKRRIEALPGATGRARFHVADVRIDPLPGADYDLIVTNFLLDCFPADELNIVLDRLSAIASPDAHWVVGDFVLPPGRVARALAHVALAGMYAFFRVVTGIPARSLVDPTPLLIERGWAPLAESSRLGGFIVSRLWQRTPTVS